MRNKSIDTGELNEFALVPVYSAVSTIWEGTATTPDRLTIQQWIDEGVLGIRLPAILVHQGGRKRNYRISLRSLKAWLIAVEDKANELANGASVEGVTNHLAAQQARERIRTMR